MANKHSDLYIVPPQFEKVAGTKMPPDTELWSEAVFSVFSEQWPDLADLSAGDVEWDEDVKIDDEYGFGVGKITINSGSTLVKIPIIVKDQHLLPIDIFEVDGKMHLLNKDNIGAALKEQDSVGSVSYPDKTDFKTTGFVDWLSKGATANGWEKRVDAFIKTAKQIGGPYVDQSLTYYIDAPMKPTKAQASVVLFEDSGKLGQLNMIGYNSGEVVQVGPMCHDDITILGNESLKEASKIAFNAGYSICPLGKIKEANVGFLGVDSTKDLGLIDKPGVYSSQAVTSDGLESVPVFAMNILLLGTNELPENPNMAFVVQGDEQIDYALQDSVVGKAQSSSKFDFSGSIVPLNDANRYDKGYLLYEDGDNIEVCSEFVTIDRIEQTPKGRLRIYMKTSQGNIHYLMDDSFQRILPLANEDNLYSSDYNLNLTGPNLSFMKVSEPIELVSSLNKHQILTDDAVIKGAENTSSMSVRYLKETEKIMAKLGNEQFEDTPQRFMARMFSMGIAPETSASVISHVQENSTPLQIVGIIPDKTAEVKIEYTDARLIMSDLNGMRTDIIKAAASMEASGGEEQAAAAVLGIGMIGEENLRYFLQVIPILEDVTNILAKMLYSARIGDVQMDEGAIKSALVNITQIIGKLRAISARV